MTEQELRDLYRDTYRFFTGERLMRLRVFPPGHPKHEQKLAEIDKAWDAVNKMKDFAKLHAAPSARQAVLFDESERVVRKGGY